MRQKSTYIKLPAVVILILALITPYTLSAAKKDFKSDKPVVYKTIGKTELKMDVFLPEGHKASDKRPAVVFFFGGGWTGGSPSQFHPHCKHLASKGIVAMSANYRVSSRNKTTPAECVKDGKSAVRWIKQNAKDLGVDPTKVMAGGGSAGGHVAAATGTTSKFEEEGEDMSVSSCPAALILFNPVYDNGPSGYGHSRVKDYWKDISPMHNISKKTPPTIVFLGTKDNLIPVATAEKYKKIMEDNGRRCVLHLYEEQPHGFFNVSKKNNYDKTIVQMDEFLVSLNYLKNNK